jgi:hypothetical protein
MSANETAAPNLRGPLLALTLAAAVIASAALCIAPVTAAGADPVPSGHVGYWAQTVCSEGDESAPAEGWAPAGFGGYPAQHGAIDTCLAIGGTLALEDEGFRDPTPRSGPEWVYEAPAVSTIAGGSVAGRAAAPHGEAFIATPANIDDPENAVVNCYSPHCPGVVNFTGQIRHPGGRLLFADALCVPSSEESVCSDEGLSSELEITSAVILLKNEAKPAGSGFSGSLLSNPASGTANLSFEATDKDGPGVYRATVQVDGVALWSATPNLNEGKCQARGTYDEALKFRNIQPCPQETGVRAEIPTAAIGDGQHHLTVEVEDAAGNTAVLYTGTITIANHPAPAPAPVRGPANGTPASENAVLTAHWNGKSASRLTSSYGRSHEITGKLTNAAGAPIAGALIEASQKPASIGAVTSSMTGPHTNAQGSFTLSVPRTSSSTTIQLAYRSHIGDPRPVATKALTLRIPASVHLTVSPHVTSVGRSIFFSGLLHGTPIPPGGKQLVLEASSGGGWVQFDTLTTNAKGRYRASYRFKFPGPVSYEFRVVSSYESDFPFLKGISNSVGVLER